jgi:ribosome biogenesis protein Tsr3
LTLDDKQNILDYGLIVIDCSWNKVLNISNIHYRKWEKLSSAEAIAAALYITNFKEFV